MSAPVETPQVAWPFRRGTDGDLVIVEQGSVEDVRACEAVIARCPLGFREDRPEFGWRPPMFRNVPLDPSSLEIALRTWEDRGDANATAHIDAAEAARSVIDVTISVEDEDG